jgi:hypothetical protein
MAAAAAACGKGAQQGSSQDRLAQVQVNTLEVEVALHGSSFVSGISGGISAR